MVIEYLKIVAEQGFNVSFKKNVRKKTLVYEYPIS